MSMAIALPIPCLLRKSFITDNIFLLTQNKSVCRIFRIQTCFYNLIRGIFMKVVILAGGMGTRLAGETETKPKPMVEIGGKPILQHIIDYYISYGHHDFYILAGYKSEVIKDYFNNLAMRDNDVSYNLAYPTLTDGTPNNSRVRLVSERTHNFIATVIETGLKTNTAGRIAYMKKYVAPDENFLLTYGDGLCDVNINSLVRYHENSGRSVTVTAICPTSRFGHLSIANNGRVMEFKEKPKQDVWVNGGFFVVHGSVLHGGILHGCEDEPWEGSPMQLLIANKEVTAYKHDGWWRCMDTIKDRDVLRKLWDNGYAPWYKGEKNA